MICGRHDLCHIILQQCFCQDSGPTSLQHWVPSVKNSGAQLPAADRTSHQMNIQVSAVKSYYIFYFSNLEQHYTFGNFRFLLANKLNQLK